MKRITQAMEEEVNEVYEDLEKVFHTYLLSKKVNGQLNSVLEIIGRLGKLRCLEGLEKSSKLASRMNCIQDNVRTGKIENRKETVDMLMFCSYFLREIMKNESEGKPHDSKYDFFMQELGKIMKFHDITNSPKSSPARFKSEPSCISRMPEPVPTHISWTQVNNLTNLIEDLIRLQSAFEHQIDEITKENPNHPDILPISEMTMILDKVIYLIQDKVAVIQRNLAETDLKKYSSTINDLSKEYIMETQPEEKQETELPDKNLWNQISDIVKEVIPESKPDVAASLWDILEPYESQFDESAEEVYFPGIESLLETYGREFPDFDTDSPEYEIEPDKSKILTSFGEHCPVEHDESYLIKAIEEMDLSEMPYFEEMMVTKEGQVYIILNRAAFF